MFRSDNRPTSILLAHLAQDSKQKARAEFEIRTDKQRRTGDVQKRFEELMSEYEAKEKEEEQRVQAELQRQEQLEIERNKPKPETKEERLQRMRARAAELKMKRETERLIVVEEKLRQKWRNDSDELRTLKSQQFAAEVASDRSQQLADRFLQKVAAIARDRGYHQLWENERLKKVAREERESAQKQSQDHKTVSELDKQMEDLRAREMLAKQLRDEESRLMRLHEETLNLEADRNKQRKEASQIMFRQQLDQANKELLLQKSRDIQASLRMDMKIVEDLSKMGQQERDSTERKKNEMVANLAEYREFLRVQAQNEKAREAELDKLYASENEKMWQKSIAYWDKEQAARDKLMAEVVAGQQQQIEERIAFNLAERQHNLQASQTLMSSIATPSSLLQIPSSEEVRAAQASYAAELARQVEEVIAKRQKALAQRDMDRAQVLQQRSEYEDRLSHEQQELTSRRTVPGPNIMPLSW